MKPYSTSRIGPCVGSMRGTRGFALGPRGFASGLRGLLDINNEVGIGNAKGLCWGLMQIKAR